MVRMPNRAPAAVKIRASMNNTAQSRATLSRVRELRNTTASKLPMARPSATNQVYQPSPTVYP